MNVWLLPLVLLSLTFAEEPKPGYAVVRSKCETDLYYPTVGDLDQYDRQIRSRLSEQKLWPEKMEYAGLCGPTCAVNAVFAEEDPIRSIDPKKFKAGVPRRGRQPPKLKLPPFERKFDKVSELIHTVKVGISQFQSSPADFLAGTNYRQVGFLLKYNLHRRFNVEAKIDYPGVLIHDIPNLTIDELKTVNHSNVRMIGSIFISGGPHKKVWAHFIIIEQLIRHREDYYLLIRDPTGGKSFWLRLEPQVYEDTKNSYYRLKGLDDNAESAPEYFHEGANVIFDFAIRAKWN
jgi:hypothetical protein